jgi:hypothetical protein
MSRQKVIEVAASQLGVKESPPDSNKTKYGEWYGENGVQWCAIFVSWVFDQARSPLGHIDTDKGYASCQDGYLHWQRTHELTTTPQEADIVLYDWNLDGHCDHTGIFFKWLEEGVSFQSYEGNTSVGNDSDGGEVMLRTRTVRYVKAFVSPKVLNS